MKKFLILVSALFVVISVSMAEALTLQSDENGPVTLPDKQLRVGDKAPRVMLTTPNFKKEAVGGATGKVQIISTIESLHTSVCDAQTMELDQFAKENSEVDVVVVTTNQPFVVQDYVKNHKLINVKLFSSFGNSSFGLQYGVQVIGGELTGITARSIFVINKQGTIVYMQISPNVDRALDIKKALDAAKAVLSQ